MSPVVQKVPMCLSPIREEEDEVDAVAKLVMKKLQSVLFRGVERYLDYDALLVHKKTLLRAATDVMRLSQDRPNGLRGALIELYLEDGLKVKRLAEVVADPQQKVHTVIKLTLHQDDHADQATLHILPAYTMERCCKP